LEKDSFRDILESLDFRYFKEFSFLREEMSKDRNYTEQIEKLLEIIRFLEKDIQVFICEGKEVPLGYRKLQIEFYFILGGACYDTSENWKENVVQAFDNYIKAIELCKDDLSLIKSFLAEKVVCFYSEESGIKLDQVRIDKLAGLHSLIVRKEVSDDDKLRSELIEEGFFGKALEFHFYYTKGKNLKKEYNAEGGEEKKTGAIENFEKAVSLFINVDSSFKFEDNILLKSVYSNLSFCFYYIGELYFNAGEFEKSEEWFKKCLNSLNLMSSLKTKVYVALPKNLFIDCYMKLSFVQCKSNKYKDCLKSLKAGLQKLEEVKLKAEVKIDEKKISSIKEYFLNKKYEVYQKLYMNAGEDKKEAIKYINLSIKVLEQIRKDCKVYPGVNLKLASINNYEKLLKIYKEQRKFLSAKEIIEKLLNLVSSDSEEDKMKRAELYFERALLNLNNKNRKYLNIIMDLKKASRFLEGVELLKIFEKLCFCYKQIENFDKVLKFAEKGLELAKESINCQKFLFYKAKAQVMTNQFADGIKSFEGVYNNWGVGKEQKKAEVLFYLAYVVYNLKTEEHLLSKKCEVFFKDGKIQISIVSQEFIFDNNFDVVKSLLEKSLELYKQGENKQAQFKCQDFLGYIYMIKGDYGKAVLEYEKALKNSRKAGRLISFVLWDKGMCEIKNGDFVAGVSSMKEGFFRNRKNLGLPFYKEFDLQKYYYERALAYMKIGKKAEAILDFEKVLNVLSEENIKRRIECYLWLWKISGIGERGDAYEQAVEYMEKNAFVEGLLQGEELGLFKFLRIYFDNNTLRTQGNFDVIEALKSIYSSTEDLELKLAVSDALIERFNKKADKSGLKEHLDNVLSEQGLDVERMIRYSYERSKCYAKENIESCTDDLEQAFTCYREHKKEFKDMVVVSDIACRLGQYYFEKQDYKKTVKYFEFLIDLSVEFLKKDKKDRADIFKYLGRSYFELEKEEEDSAGKLKQYTNAKLYFEAALGLYDLLEDKKECSSFLAELYIYLNQNKSCMARYARIFEKEQGKKYDDTDDCYIMNMELLKAELEQEQMQDKNLGEVVDFARKKIIFYCNIFNPEKLTLEQRNDIIAVNVGVIKAFVSDESVEIQEALSELVEEYNSQEILKLEGYGKPFIVIRDIFRYRDFDKDRFFEILRQILKLDFEDEKVKDTLKNINEFILFYLKERKDVNFIENLTKLIPELVTVFVRVSDTSLLSSLLKLLSNDLFEDKNIEDVVRLEEKINNIIINNVEDVDLISVISEGKYLKASTEVKEFLEQKLSCLVKGSNLEQQLDELLIVVNMQIRFKIKDLEELKRQLRGTGKLSVEDKGKLEDILKIALNSKENKIKYKALNMISLMLFYKIEISGEVLYEVFNCVKDIMFNYSNFSSKDPVLIKKIFCVFNQMLDSGMQIIKEECVKDFIVYLLNSEDKVFCLESLRIIYKVSNKGIETLGDIKMSFLEFFISYDKYDVKFIRIQLDIIQELFKRKLIDCSVVSGKLFYYLISFNSEIIFKAYKALSSMESNGIDEYTVYLIRILLLKKQLDITQEDLSIVTFLLGKELNLDQKNVLKWIVFETLKRKRFDLNIRALGISYRMLNKGWIKYYEMSFLKEKVFGLFLKKSFKVKKGALLVILRLMENRCLTKEDVLLLRKDIEICKNYSDEGLSRIALRVIGAISENGFESCETESVMSSELGSFVSSEIDGRDSFSESVSSAA
jgi:tetratricopeptide (TPR) repeat protein